MKATRTAPIRQTLRVLLMADSHLGFDLPTRPRVRRRRRGHDFLANHDLALGPALSGEIDLVIHGGDVFHRSRVAPSLVHQAFAGLKRVADLGVPVFVVPGNHERSRIPHRRLVSHPGIHVFDAPGTRAVRAGGVRVGVSGFPYQRRGVRSRFGDLLAASRWAAVPADIRLLCIHHCVEGATVGPGDYTFRKGDDVIAGSDLPSRFAAVVSGHIHRHQVLTSDLAGVRLPAPVVYPGSVERTSTAEIGETKGYVVLEFDSVVEGGRMKSVEFRALPARPMVVRDAAIQHLNEASKLDGWIRDSIAGVAPDAVLRLRIQGAIPPPLRPLLAGRRIRELAPETMNVDVVVLDDGGARVRPSPDAPADDPRQIELQL